MESDQGSRYRGKAQAIVHYFGRLDMFRVVQDQENCLTTASTSGTVISLITSFFIIALMIQETYLFFKGSVRSSMFVPSVKVKSEPMETVHLSVSFPLMPCNMLGIAIVDQHGNLLPELMRPTSARKYRLAPGNWKKSLELYREGQEVDQNEGCRLDGSIMIDKVPGHFLVGALGQRQVRVSSQHIIHEMWIGNERLNMKRDGIDEDLVNPLRDMDNTNEPSDTMYKFYLQVVPTYFRNDKGGKVRKLGYQYTASTTKISAPHMPSGLYFSHKHSSLAVEYRFHYDSWSHFIVGLCAIVGGVYTVMGFLNSAVEAIGDAPTVSKIVNFIANYFAGRRKQSRDAKGESAFPKPSGTVPKMPQQAFAPPPHQPYSAHSGGHLNAAGGPNEGHSPYTQQGPLFNSTGVHPPQNNTSTSYFPPAPPSFAPSLQKTRTD